MTAVLEKIVMVTRKTRLAELVERFNTRRQAEFWIERAGGDFREYDDEDVAYRRALELVQIAAHEAAGAGVKTQVIDRSFLSTFLFTKHDVVVTVGPDGLVANAAKYVGRQPILGVNPDPRRIDGVLLPFRAEETRAALRRVLSGTAKVREVTLAEARLSDGQRLLAFNDLFLGARTHVSARYQIAHAGRAESQSSSGVVVSTGAGSTGWLSSVFQMAAGVTVFAGGTAGKPPSLGWSDRRLVFAVREPFVSRHSSAEIVAGLVDADAPLELESRMPQGGVVFSDGIESDFLEFNSGSLAKIGIADHAAQLVVG